MRECRYLVNAGQWSADLPPRSTDLLFLPLRRTFGTGPEILDPRPQLWSWSPESGTYDGIHTYEDVIRWVVNKGALFMAIPPHAPVTCFCSGPYACPRKPPTLDSEQVLRVMAHHRRIHGT